MELRLRGGWDVVHLCDPYFTIWPRVAGRLGVAYRRPSDVRRSGNDWSIAPRRFLYRVLRFMRRRPNVFAYADPHFFIPSLYFLFFKIPSLDIKSL